MKLDREAYVNEVSRIIKQNFRPDDVSGSMTAAKAGLLVRQVLQAGPTEQGFSNFKEALLELERQGEIKTGFNSKQAFAVWLRDAAASKGPSEELGGGLQERKPFRPLKKLVWQAFVIETPVGRRYMNKRTGEVRLGQDLRPEPEDEWPEIQKVPDAEERADARVFIEAEGLKENRQLQEALESEYWYSQFPERLRALGGSLVAKWNRRRSAKVFEKAEAWRVRHDIPAALVYQSTGPRREEKVPVDIGVSGQLRDALLSAIDLMDTAELLDLRIPARCLVRVLRPDLSLHE